MIAEAAYFRAERRGFVGGDPVTDWIEAQAEVEGSLRQNQLDRLLARADEAVASATAKVAALKKKAANLSAKARAEWQEDVERLGELRDALQLKAAELREQGTAVGDKALQHAERLWSDIGETLERVAAKGKR
ncbi:MAG TPA: DUF2934 domain-containing protein [Steroidobacteraceae bacterium]|nr:DUF2934 domain-containing protein [Steroidobacteraceae bacterium]